MLWLVFLSAILMGSDGSRSPHNRDDKEGGNGLDLDGELDAVRSIISDAIIRSL